MNGGAHHENCVEQLDRRCQEQCFYTRIQAPFQKDGNTRYVDLLASRSKPKLLLLIEVEMKSNERAINDIVKWRHFEERYPSRTVILWIVTPTAHVARLIKSRIKRALNEVPEQVFVLTLFDALEQLNTVYSG